MVLPALYDSRWSSQIFWTTQSCSTPWPTQRFDKLFAEGPLIISDGQRSRLRPISLHFYLGFQFLRKYSWSTLADGISFQGTSCLLRRLLPSNEVGHLHFILFFSNQSRRRDFVWLFFGVRANSTSKETTIFNHLLVSTHRHPAS